MKSEFTFDLFDKGVVKRKEFRKKRQFLHLLFDEENIQKRSRLRKNFLK